MKYEETSRPVRSQSANSRKSPRSEAVSSLADILPAVCAGLSLEKKVNELALLSLWTSVVTEVAGALAGERSRAVKLQKRGDQRVLLVRVAHAALASELSFHAPALRAVLNRYAPQTGLTVDQIQLTVGSG